MATSSSKHQFDTMLILEGLLKNLDENRPEKNAFRLKRAGKLYLNLVFELEFLSKDERQKMMQRLDAYPDLQCPTSKGKIVNLFRKILGNHNGILFVSNINSIRKKIKTFFPF